MLNLEMLKSLFFKILLITYGQLSNMIYCKDVQGYFDILFAC